MTKNFRIEKDSMGTIEGPMKALWGAQTQRSIMNFIDQSDLEECFNPSIHLNNCLLYTSPSPRD